MIKIKLQLKFIIPIFIISLLVFGFSFYSTYAKSNYWAKFFSWEQKHLINKFARDYIKKELKNKKKNWKGIFSSFHIKNGSIKDEDIASGELTVSDIEDLDSTLASKLSLTGGTMTGDVTFSSSQTFLTNSLTGAVAIANGGTGLASLGSNSQYFKVNAGGTALEYDTLTGTDVGLGSVENTALSTSLGTANITTLGTIASGTWNGSLIGAGALDFNNSATDSYLVKWDNTSGKIQWTPNLNGEINTASNQGSGGVGAYLQKTGVDLEFKNINAGSNKVTVVNDAGNNEIDIDIAEANLTLNNLGGPLGTTKGGTGLSALGSPDQYLQVNATGDGLEYDTLTGADIGLGSVENTALSTWVGTTNITTLGTVATGTWNATAIAIAKGGTGLTALGSANQYLRADSGGTALEFYTLAKSDVGLGSVENTALSTWAGTTNITTLGTIAAGTWNGTVIPVNKGGTGLSALGSPDQYLQVNAAGDALEYDTLTGADVGLGSVTNTALSTWVGTANVTTLGTIATGTWNGTAIAEAKLDISNDPSDTYILKWNVALGKMTWIVNPAAGGVPSGFCMVSFAQSSCSAGWTMQTAQAGKTFYLVSSGPGDTGGADTHTHGVGTYVGPSHTHSSSLSAAAAVGAADINPGSCPPGNFYLANASHTHAITGATAAGGTDALTGTSDSGSNWAPYVEVILCCKD